MVQSDNMQGANSPRMPQLDGLRLAAVLMVFYHHWVPGRYTFGFPSGEVGVELFFVLSGFLITGILLRCREWIESGEQGLAFTARQFYLRRALRIFPLYFAFLAGYALIAREAVNELTPWLWTYTLNLYRTFVDDQWGGPISHLWSLAVEEQFYLVWPWVILLVPRRFLGPTLLGAVALGPVSEGVMALLGFSDRAVQFFTLSSLDALALGGGLAYLLDRREPNQVPGAIGGIFMKGLLWGGLLVSVLGGFLPNGSFPFSDPLIGLGRTLLLGWVVIRAAAGFSGPVGRLLGARPVVYLGRISYGLYLLHKPIPFALERAGIVIAAPLPVLFLIYTVLAILAASLSWHLFEAPLLALNRHFPYHTKKSVASAPTLATGLERGQ